MKLSDYTMSVLKNFSTINSGVVLLKGNIQKTISEDKSVMAEAEFEDTFPSKFGVYDLNHFIGNVSTLNSPELDFQDRVVTIDDGSLKLTYVACDPTLIKTPPEDKTLDVGTPDVSFELSKTSLVKLLRLAAMNNLPHLSLVGKNGKLSVEVHDRKNDTSNQAIMEIAEYAGKDFIATFSTENLKMIPDDYVVDVKLPVFARFKSKTKKLTYFNAFEVIK